VVIALGIGISTEPPALGRFHSARALHWTSLPIGVGEGLAVSAETELLLEGSVRRYSRPSNSTTALVATFHLELDLIPLKPVNFLRKRSSYMVIERCLLPH